MSNSGVFPSTHHWSALLDIGLTIQALTENNYSCQSTWTCPNTNAKETEQMIGMYLKVGLMDVSGVCDSDSDIWIQFFISIIH